MTGAAIGLVLAVVCCAYLQWLLRVPRPGRHRGQLPPETSQPEPADRTSLPGRADSPVSVSGWLLATLPAARPASPPWPPRICAGRVAPNLAEMASRAPAWSMVGWIPPAAWSGGAPERIAA